MERPSQSSVAFVQFLRAAGLPETLWDRLLERLETGELGCTILKAVQREGIAQVEAAQALPAEGDVWLLQHIVAATRTKLQQLLQANAQLLEACALLLRLQQSPGEQAVSTETVCSSFWRAARPSITASASQQDVSVWHLESPEAAWMRHSELPLAKVAALPDSIGSGLAPYGLSMLWLSGAVKAGEEVTRNHWPQGARSLQRAASLLCLLQPQQWRHAQERDAYQATLRQAMATQRPPGVGQPMLSRLPRDSRPWSEGKTPSRVFCTYPVFREAVQASTQWELVEEPEAADVLLTAQPIKAFMQVPSCQLVNQFPYEGCLVRKDLLPQTLRRSQSQQQVKEAEAAPASDRSHPPWYPATYDLATEVQFFLADHARRAEAGVDNHWVIKPVLGTCSPDACLTDNAATVVRYREALGGRIVQKYVHQPVLWQGRKFDVRVYLLVSSADDPPYFKLRSIRGNLVRSFKPLEAFLYSGWYGRTAAGPCKQLTRTGSDDGMHLTSSCYASPQDGAIIEQVMVPTEAMKAEFAAQGLDIEDFEQQLRSCARQLLEAAGPQIGEWPRSRAMYNLDMMCTPAPQPANGSKLKRVLLQLLEVNFCPDITTVSAWTQGSFAAQVLDVLFLHDPLIPETLWPLHDWAPAGLADDID